MNYKNKKLYIEVLRIIGIFFVLYAHTDTNAVHHYLFESNTASYWIAVALQQFMYLNTAIFFMISGILLLNKEEPLKTVITKRVLKFLAIIIIFDFLQYCYNFCNNPAIGFDIFIILKRMYATTMITQYWYLYTYLAFLLMLPFMRILVKNMSNTLGIYLLAGYAVIQGILPLLEILWKNDRLALNVPLYVNVIILPILGYFLEHRFFDLYIKNSSRKLTNIIIVNVCFIAAWGLNIWYTYKRMLDGLYFYNADGLTFIMLIGLYIDVRLICEKFQEIRERKGKEKLSFIGVALRFIGSGAFVVYLFEPELREGFQFIYDKLYLKISWLLATVLWLGACIIVGSMMAYVKDFAKDLLKK